MRREQLLARLLRALSGKTQEQLAEATGIHPILIAQVERGQNMPQRDQLARMARCAAIQLADAEEILDLYETLRRERQRQGADIESLLVEMARRMESSVQAAHRRLLRRRLPDQPPQEEDRQRAEEQWRVLAGLTHEGRQAAVRAAAELQTWALCERICQESERRASVSVEDAAALASLAVEIAEGVPGPESWRRRVQGYAAAHAANVHQIAGDLEAAAAALARARLLWREGADPASLLDPRRLLEV